MKYVIILFLISIVITSCNPKNLLESYYKYDVENSYLEYDTDIQVPLLQTVCYNSSRRTDRQLVHNNIYDWCYHLFINLNDTAAIRTKQQLNVEIDTTLINIGLLIIPIKKIENNKIKGTIQIVRMDEDSITINENITTIRENGEIKYFIGTQTFKKKSISNN